MNIVNSGAGHFSDDIADDNAGRRESLNREPYGLLGRWITAIWNTKRRVTGEGAWGLGGRRTGDLSHFLSDVSHVISAQPTLA
ncbi:hypothetical protein HJFPF1_09092 [Paramyrothecium foliicola]|nr:hypothetical protein HJFPF1_09092 [Paramyrothecium foliicola]